MIQASLIVADELYQNLLGKVILQGIYLTELRIGVEPHPAPQLIFYFIVEADLKEALSSIVLQIKMPGEEAPREMRVPVPTIIHYPEGRTRQSFRIPFLCQGLMLRQGHIEAKVIHDKGEIVVGSPWITLAGTADTVARGTSA